MTQSINDIQKEFDENFGSFKSGKGFRNPDFYAIQEFLSQKLQQQEESYKAELMEKVEAKQVLHKHDSIPSFTAGLEDGCLICVKNKALDSVLKLLN